MDVPPLLRMAKSGSINLILGPMFSGKTTELLRRVRRQKYAKKRCLVVKFAQDTRYSEDKAATHDKVLHEAVAVSKLSHIDPALTEQADVIGIDEGQFFSDIVSFAENMAKRGKVVIIAALDGTFQRKAFGNFLEIIPLSETIQKLSAVCQVCHEEAHFTRRISDEKDVRVVGGTDKYLSVCRACFSAPLPGTGSVTKKTSCNATHKVGADKRRNKLKKQEDDDDDESLVTVPSPKKGRSNSAASDISDQNLCLRSASSFSSNSTLSELSPLSPSTSSKPLAEAACTPPKETRAAVAAQ
eukprot:jgi/Bigna1/54794/estExt_Genewise1Plus.C_430051